VFYYKARRVADEILSHDDRHVTIFRVLRMLSIDEDGVHEKVRNVVVVEIVELTH